MICWTSIKEMTKIMQSEIKIADQIISKTAPTFIIAEIGINHNGSVELAKKLIDIAQTAGCNAVKFQKRTVEKVYSPEELAMPRESVFGMTNGDLKRGLEFSYEQYKEIDLYCKSKGILWFASCWDEESVDFIDQFNPPCYKIASASLTDDKLLKYTRSKGVPILLSTGMSTIEQIEHAVSILGKKDLLIFHCTSTYPTEHSEINLNVIGEFERKFDCLVGYSGHERGLIPTVVSVVKGAVAVERHITTDRTLWGSDQAASLEPGGLYRLVRDIRTLPQIYGNGKKIVYEREKPIIKKLRKV